MAEAPVLLETRGLSRRFGGLHAVDGVDLQIRQGAIHCVIGPNGAGKSTLFNLVSGMLPPSSGSVTFRGQDVTGKQPHAISRLGLARSFQTPRVFPSLSVLDHVLLASREHPHDCPIARGAMSRVDLEDRAAILAGDLAHGEKKRLELAMALAMQPALVLLDEPTAGMNAHETAAIAGIVRDAATTTTAVVIEHDIDFVRGIADVVTVMHKGRVLREGTIVEIERDDEVRRVYLGGGVVTLLAVNQLHAGYGRAPALFGVDLHVAAGEIVALLGRNGVGKTTTLRSIVGQTTRVSGTVAVDGVAIERLPAHAIARMGVAYVPEDRGVFPGLTVAENLRLGRLAGGEASDVEHAIARFPVLGERLEQDAGALSGGERQMLALGRALLARPRLLLIDEFSEGLQPSVVHELAAGLGEIAAGGVGVLLVEQNARLALRVSARCYVMEKGVVVDEGSAADFLEDDERLREHLVV